MLLVLWKRWFTHERDSGKLSEAGNAPEKLVAAIQAGDEGLRESFIAQYSPFIAKTAGKFCRRYIDPERDDEFSVALAAFNEAIGKYSPDAGGRFLGFAETVITRRLIDHARQEQRHAATVPFSALAEDGEEDCGYLSRMESAAALEAMEESRTAEQRRAEIESLSEQLAGFGIRFRDLAENSPRHRDSRKLLLSIGQRLAQNETLFRMMQEKRQLPVKELCMAEPVSRKTVERHRKYLIAVSLIAGGSYPCLRQYIKIERGGEEESRP